MFGNDNHKDDDTATTEATVADTTPAADPASPFSSATDTTITASSPNDATIPAPSTRPTIEPLTPSTPAEAEDKPEDDTAATSAAAADAILAAPVTPPAPSAPAGVVSDELLDIKQNALEQLRPLVDHLDPVPEEKFDALMMMIRASDDQTLIQPAYDTAQQITDDKKRAEALLDVVNEINYLTSTQQ